MSDMESGRAGEAPPGTLTPSLMLVPQSSVLSGLFSHQVKCLCKEAQGGKGDTMSKLGKQFLEIHFCLTSQNIITPCHKRAVQNKVACVLSFSHA